MLTFRGAALNELACTQEGGCLLAKTIFLPHRANWTGQYGRIGQTVRERSVHVQGHEIRVSGEAISPLTSSARGWPSLHHRSTEGTHPHRLLLDCNRSNYFSLLVTVARLIAGSEKGGKESLSSHHHQ